MSIRTIDRLKVKVAAATTIAKGDVLVSAAEGNGYAKPADDDADDYVVLGRARSAVDNSAGDDGDATVVIELPRTVFCLLFTNDETAPVVQANIFGKVYLLNPTTVSADDDDGSRSIAGRAWKIEDDGLIAVEVLP
jgi:hypothetical protein